MWINAENLAVAHVPFVHSKSDFSYRDGARRSKISILKWFLDWKSSLVRFETSDVIVSVEDVKSDEVKLIACEPGEWTATKFIPLDDAEDDDWILNSWIILFFSSIVFRINSISSRILSIFSSWLSNLTWKKL